MKKSIFKVILFLGLFVLITGCLDSKIKVGDNFDNKLVNKLVELNVVSIKMKDRRDTIVEFNDRDDLIIKSLTIDNIQHKFNHEDFDVVIENNNLYYYLPSRLKDVFTKKGLEYWYEAYLSHFLEEIEEKKDIKKGWD